jgi:hypothetical protein
MDTMRGIIGGAVLALALTACGGEAQTPQQTPSPTTTTRTADPTACKAALEKLYADAVTSSKTGEPPFECQGVDNATVQKYVEEIVAKAFEDMGSATTSP